MNRDKFFEKLKQRMMEHGKYVKIPEGSKIRQIFGLDINETEEKEEE